MSADPVAEAAAAARRGELIVLPTDTVYGIGTRPDDPAATSRLFEAKARPRDLTFPVLVASIGDARRIASFDDRAERLALFVWPGPLTVVLRRADESRSWDLGGDKETIGVRIPADPLALAVLARTGPLAVTSANVSGQPPAQTCDELVAAFGDSVAVYLCKDEPLEGTSSTVVDLAHGEPKVLREGSAAPEVISRLLSGQEPLLDSGPS
jgi:tRNA threonylcarbamoyl adenosine modification protein (Sua5/YciO/YrdC/YwlC family)